MSRADRRLANVHKVVRGSVAIFLLLSPAGCSFSQLLPPKEPSKRAAKADKQCGNPLYPIADAASVIAGYTWVHWSNQQERKEANQSMDYDQFGQPITRDSHSSDSRYAVARGFGYGAMVAFGLGAIYGTYVEFKCARLRRETEAATKANAPPVRPGFPESVFEFKFGSALPEAQRACAIRAAEWRTESASAYCSHRTKTMARPDFRFEFALGTLSGITLRYYTSPERLERDYEALNGAMRRTFGDANTEPSALSRACADSVWACLQQGETRPGPEWHWANGSIELMTRAVDGRPVVEARYTREEGSPP
ncbi:MAG TPA: hypothetical protein VFQ61_20180 [Polyangiaceae bacterium]|nr:hypothetical protein [Polyangiaceae bacterium]